jgi:hypothetical protein
MKLIAAEGATGFASEHEMPQTGFVKDLGAFKLLTFCELWRRCKILRETAMPGTWSTFIAH